MAGFVGIDIGGTFTDVVGFNTVSFFLQKCHQLQRTMLFFTGAPIVLSLSIKYH